MSVDLWRSFVSRLPSGILSKWVTSVFLAAITGGCIAGILLLHTRPYRVPLLGIIALLSGGTTVWLALQAIEMVTCGDRSLKGKVLHGACSLPCPRQPYVGANSTFTCTQERMDVLLENERLRAILKWAPVGIVYFGPGRTVRFCNEEFCKSYGGEESELVGGRLPLPESRREEWTRLEEGLRKGEPFRDVRTVRMRKDGTLLDAYISGVPLFDDNRELVGLIGVIVEAENMPIGSIEYEHIMALAESSSDFLLLLDTDLRILYANPGFSVATDVDHAVLQGTSVVDYFPADEREVIQSNFREALTSERAIYVLKAHIRSNDTVVDIPVRIEFYPVYGADSKTPSGIACIAHDLQKEMELREQLRQSKAEIQMIFENSPIGITKVDTRGLPLASNRKFREILGYSEDEVTSRPFSDFVYPDDLKEVSDLFLDLIAGTTNHFETLKRLVRKDRSVIYATMTGLPGRDPKGDPSHTICMVTPLPGGKIRLERGNSPEAEL